MSVHRCQGYFYLLFVVKTRGFDCVDRQYANRYKRILTTPNYIINWGKSVIRPSAPACRSSASYSIDFHLSPFSLCRQPALFIPPQPSSHSSVASISAWFCPLCKICLLDHLQFHLHIMFLAVASLKALKYGSSWRSPNSWSGGKGIPLGLL